MPNKTQNYNLTQYVGTDEINPLTDYNVDMFNIDKTMKANENNIKTVSDKSDIHISNTAIHLNSTQISRIGAAVQNDLKINNHPLNSNIQLSSEDIGSFPIYTTYKYIVNKNANTCLTNGFYCTGTWSNTPIADGSLIVLDYKCASTSQDVSSTAIVLQYFISNNNFKMWKRIFDCVNSGANSLTTNWTEITINPNILINSDFKIWQRLHHTPISTTYTADRWLAHNNSTVQPWIINQNPQYGVSVEVISGSNIVDSRYSYLLKLSQPFENMLIDGKYTVSIKYKSTMNSFNINLNNSDLFMLYATPDWTIATHTFDATSVNELALYFLNVGIVDIQWIKLEYGFSPTTYIYPNYSSELAICRKFFKKVLINGIVGYTSSYFNSSNTKNIYIPLDVEDMITNAPIITLSTATELIVDGNDTSGTYTNAEVTGYEINLVNDQHVVTLDETAVDFRLNDRILIQNKLGRISYIDIDAEIYPS